MGQILYCSLTTGAGMQTLGEEYCDILQVTGQSLVPMLFVSDSLTATLTVLQDSTDQQGVVLLYVHDCIYAENDGKLSRCPRTTFFEFCSFLGFLCTFLGSDQIGNSAERPPTYSASWASQSQLTDQASAVQPRFASTGEPAFSSLRVTLVFICPTFHSCLIHVQVADVV